MVVVGVVVVMVMVVVAEKSTGAEEWMVRQGKRGARRRYRRDRVNRWWEGEGGIETESVVESTRKGNGGRRKNEEQNSLSEKSSSAVLPRRPLHAHMLPPVGTRSNSLVMLYLSFSSWWIRHTFHPALVAPSSRHRQSPRVFFFSRSSNVRLAQCWHIRVTSIPCIFLLCCPRHTVHVARVPRRRPGRTCALCGLAQPRRTSRNMCTIKYTQKCLPATYVYILFLRSVGSTRSAETSGKETHTARESIMAYLCGVPGAPPPLRCLFQHRDLQYRWDSMYPIHVLHGRDLSTR